MKRALVLLCGASIAFTACGEDLEQPDGGTGGSNGRAGRRGSALPEGGAGASSESQGDAGATNASGGRSSTGGGAAAGAPLAPGAGGEVAVGAAGGAGVSGQTQGGEAGAVGAAGAAGGGGVGGAGGAGGAGGDGESGAGGDAGAGGSGGSGDLPPSECGDDEVGQFEECDDENQTNGDGCSSDCRLEACTACRADRCEAEGLGFLKCEGLHAQSGADPADIALCDALLSCVRRTGCHRALNTNGQPDMRICYCGDLTTDECFTDETDPLTPNGPCKQEAIAASKLGSTAAPVSVGTRYYAPTNPLGYAMQGLVCEVSQAPPQGCADVCFPNTGSGGTGGTGSGGATGGTSTGGAGTTGGTGTGGTSGGTTSTGGTGTGGSSGCSECMTSKCAGTQADRAARCGDGSCADYLACVVTSNCDDALNENQEPDMRICYCGDLSPDQCFSDETDPAEPNGPCKSQLEPLLRTTLPLTIGTRFFNPAEKGGVIHQEILCRQRDCSDVCQ